MVSPDQREAGVFRDALYMIWKNALALQRDYGAGAGTASDDQLVSMRGLHELPAPVCLLSGKGYCKTERSRAEEDLLGNAGSISEEHYNGARHLPADVPFYSSRRGVWTAQK